MTVRLELTEREASLVQDGLVALHAGYARAGPECADIAQECLLLFAKVSKQAWERVEDDNNV